MLKTKTLLLNDVGLKFKGADGGTFSGYASVFGGVDSYRDTIMPGAYKQVLDLIKAGAMRMPKMFINHKSWEMPVGKWTLMEEDEKGLYVEGEFTPGNPEAAVAKAALHHNTVDGLSIGYSLSSEDVEFRDDIRVIKNISKLHEISVVTYPADDDARIESVKSALELVKDIRDLEDFLRDAGGFSKTLAAATAGHCKRIFARSDSDVMQLPKDLAALIAANLDNARTL